MHQKVVARVQAEPHHGFPGFRAHRGGGARARVHVHAVARVATRYTSADGPGRARDLAHATISPSFAAIHRPFHSTHIAVGNVVAARAKYM